MYFINDSRKCKSAHNHGKSDRKEWHEGGMTAGLFTKLVKKLFDVDKKIIIPSKLSLGKNYYYQYV